MAPPGPTILVLVLSVDREPWLGIESQGQRATWASPEAIPAGCEVFYYYGAEGPYRFVGRAVGRLALLGGQGLLARAVRRIGNGLLAGLSKRGAKAPPRLTGDRLFTRVPDAHKFTLPKLINALRWATAPGMPRFDYVYRTNTSSYLALPRLREVAAAMPRRDCYAGFIGQHPSGRYASGSGMLMSWDVAALAGGALAGWEWGETDDVALGAFLAESGILPQPLPRIDTPSADDVGRLTNEELREAFHFRCKSASEPRTDVAIMRAIHARLYGAIESSSDAESD